MVSKVRLFALVFPIAIGFLLTGVGIMTFGGAHLWTRKERALPYGFLVFSSVELEYISINIEMGSIEVESDRAVDGRISFDFGPVHPTSGRQTIGFQFPYGIEHGEHDVVWINEHESPVRILIVEEEVQHGDRPWQSQTSLVYTRFEASPNDRSYSGEVTFTLANFLVRKDFTSFGLIFPFALTEESVHAAIHQNFPGAYVWLGPRSQQDQLTFVMGVGGPLDFESAIPPPDNCLGKEYHTLHLLWEIPTPYVISPTFAGRRSAQNIAVYFKSLPLIGQRDSAIFSSGTFSGLGFGFILTGIYDVLRTVIEARERKRHQRTNLHT